MPIEHPFPTPATVKSLYARAFSCAYLNCNQPLYREDEVSGTWTLNSRISHICARSEGGPRWDPDQSPEGNRSDANLLLLCLEHASAIDDAQAIHAYPVPLLREWKDAQVEEYRQRMAGWPLTTAMAEAALAASFSNVGVVISNSTLHLGGEGGRAPGAGGGGGGAIGPGARAGKGGDGGRITDLEGNPLPAEETAAFLATMELAGLDPPPGSGGSGAGAIGPAAVAGDGGHGGDGMAGAISVEPGDILEIEVGGGGEPPRLPGQHASSGGASVIRVRSADGDLKRVIRAAGGNGTKAGGLPDDWLPISSDDLAGGFTISTLMTCNAAEVREGVLYTLAGSWFDFPIASLPSDAIWSIVCVATWERITSGHIRGLQFCLTNPDQIEVSRLAFSLPGELADAGSCKWLQNIGAPLDREGVWTVSVQSGDYRLSQIHIRVLCAGPI